MDRLIVEQIAKLIDENKDLLRIAIRQRAKFEGWLKFELAYRLEQLGLEDVEVETILDRKRDRPDVSFFKDSRFHRVELKTCNTSWNVEGIPNKSKPTSNNIKGIINDAKKLNSNQGIVAFVMFPIPPKDERWKVYLERIQNETEIKIDFERNCRLIEVELDKRNTCELLACAFMSRRFHNWF